MRIDYQRIKAIPFEDVLAHYEIQLQEKQISGDRKLVGRCPIHTNGLQARNRNHFQVTAGSKRPGLENTFHCFACGARGTVIDFVVLMEKLVAVDSVDWERVSDSRKEGSKWNWCPTEKLKLASQLLHAWFIDTAPSAPALRAGSQDATTPKTEPAPLQDDAPAVNQTWVERWGKMPTYPKFYVPSEYLDARGIRPEVLKEFGVGFYSNPGSRSPLNNHILFPIENDSGDLVGYAWRTTKDSGQRYCFPPKNQLDRTLELWNLHRALKRSTRVVVVEGFFSCMNLWQLGHNCVALMGSTISTTQMQYLCEHFHSATFLVEPDEAGHKLRRHVVEKLLPLLAIRLIQVDTDPDLMTGVMLHEALG